jgi:hypothetical protein
MGTLATDSQQQRRLGPSPGELTLGAPMLDGLQRAQAGRRKRCDQNSRTTGGNARAVAPSRARLC